jgi:predicted alpha-1,2-mannosidase
MKNYKYTLFSLFIWSVGTLMAQESGLDYVDPFIGAGASGAVFIGPNLPSGMVKLGPDCNDLTHNSGWDAKGQIKGFSHTHLNGTGGGCIYGNVLLTPTTGAIDPANYGSDRGTEYAEVGLYTAELTTYNVNVRLSATGHAGMHEYTFPETDKANILIDLGSFLISTPVYGEEQKFVGSEVRILSDTEIEGYTRVRGGWNIGAAYTVYFHAKFDTPATSFGTWKSGKIEAGSKMQYDTNEKTGAYFTFDTHKKQTVKVKVGISYLGVNKAQHNTSEIAGWDLDVVKDNARSEWNKILKLIDIEGGTTDEKKIFYSAVYRIFMQPNDYTEENPVWQTDKPYFGDYQAIWDTYRVTHPFINLLKPSLGGRMLESLVDIYRNDSYMPDARTNHTTGRTQGGSNCDMLVADAYLKGVTGVDYETALNAMLKNATVPPGDNEQKWGRGGLPDYNKIGYVSTDYERSVSRTLEYGPNDWAIATLAKGLGKQDIYEKYKQQASHWENLWNPDIESKGFKGFAWPRLSDGSWLGTDEFNVLTAGSWKEPFYETFSWELSFYVPHDVKRLIEKTGGKETFSKRLDTYFTDPPESRFGMCQISNEPAFLTPSLYCYVNEPYKTAKIARRILSMAYNATRTGIFGNDDSGSMGAWFAFHAMGFFPNAGQDVYLISSPLFKKVTIHLENGKTFVITAQNASEKNIYVQSCKLNGKPLENTWFRHSDIAGGGELNFVMGSKPSGWATNGQAPPSMSDNEIHF